MSSLTGERLAAALVHAAICSELQARTFVRALEASEPERRKPGRPAKAKAQEPGA